MLLLDQYGGGYSAGGGVLIFTSLYAISWKDAKRERKLSLALAACTQAGLVKEVTIGEGYFQKYAARFQGCLWMGYLVWKAGPSLFLIYGILSTMEIWIASKFGYTIPHFLVAIMFGYACFKFTQFIGEPLRGLSDWTKKDKQGVKQIPSLEDEFVKKEVVLQLSVSCEGKSHEVLAQQHKDALLTLRFVRIWKSICAAAALGICTIGEAKWEITHSTCLIIFVIAYVVSEIFIKRQEESLKQLGESSSSGLSMEAESEKSYFSNYVGSLKGIKWGWVIFRQVISEILLILGMSTYMLYLVAQVSPALAGVFFFVSLVGGSLRCVRQMTKPFRVLLHPGKSRVKN